jgi:hypothetical protein
MKLSVELEKWRADRPDEWKMDEFIRKAAELESNRDAIIERLLCLSVSGHSIIDLDRRLADLVRGAK